MNKIALSIITIGLIIGIGIIFLGSKGSDNNRINTGYAEC
jgi:hypothetical protein